MYRPAASALFYIRYDFINLLLRKFPIGRLLRFLYVSVLRFRFRHEEFLVLSNPHGFAHAMALPHNVHIIFILYRQRKIRILLHDYVLTDTLGVFQDNRTVSILCPYIHFLVSGNVRAACHSCPLCQHKPFQVFQFFQNPFHFFHGCGISEVFPVQSHQPVAGGQSPVRPPVGIGHLSRSLSLVYGDHLQVRHLMEQYFLPADPRQGPLFKLKPLRRRLTLQLCQGIFDFSPFRIRPENNF